MQRASGVPQVTPSTHVEGPPWWDCSRMTAPSRAISCFLFWVSHRRQVVGGISLASPPWLSRGHCHSFSNDSQL